ncbi:MAG: methyltransferase domain-containing protein [Canidatus Methanoxibalbensis ujae]|nr:methyltransferase domain-containing protein [Candidatus Methanoxibalbensis ujae]MCW7078485.1 methyltransferase domain-containing protein [Candidatus Methanoxibalbensis ujae]
MNSIEIFERYAQEYDEWFDANRFAYESEVQALKKFVPKNSKGLEVGVGTGRFAVPLGIGVGVEPAKAMADIARKRGIEVYEAKAEKLPFDDSSFDFVLIVVTICFVQNPMQALREAKRVLKPGGYIIIGMIDRESFLGKLYESKKKESKFYRHANFYSTRQVLDWLKKLEFEYIKTCQTIFKDPKKITGIEPVKEGYGEGGFVVISAQKQA